MKIALSSFVSLAATVLAACYGARDSNEHQGDTAIFPDSGAAGGAAGVDGSSGGRVSYPPKGRPPSRDPQPAPGKGGSGGVDGGAGGCGAFRTPDNDRLVIDQAAFTGIGGAGAMLAGTCQRCGWDSRGDMCQTLVASVPTISNSNYYPCLDLSIEFASCLEVESCVCGGDVPARCASIKAKQDACLSGKEPFDADGGTDGASGWSDVETRCNFGFKAPADYRNMPVQGTDSCVLQFYAAGCEFSADYGWYSGALSRNPGDLDYREASAEIDGRSAAVVAYAVLEPTRYMAGVHFATVDPKSPGTKLTILATCHSASAQSDALTLFSTIHFE